VFLLNHSHVLDDLDRVADRVGTVGPFFNVLPLKQAELIVTIGSELRCSGDQQESIGSGWTLDSLVLKKKCYQW
jgi:hypothetical protein